MLSHYPASGHWKELVHMSDALAFVAAMNGHVAALVARGVSILMSNRTLTTQKQLLKGYTPRAQLRGNDNLPVFL